MKATNKAIYENSELTFEKLRSYKGFENVTEAEAEQQIKAIKALAKILYYVAASESKKETD